jgi:CHAD domain-containing protein
MLGARTPGSLLDTQIVRLQAELPRLRDGDVDGIHDARVATRRIRELLPLTDGRYGREKTAELADQFRRVGRALGHVRDADVQIALARSLGERVLSAAPVLIVVRQENERQRLAMLRDLIKGLERLDIDDLLRSMHRVAARSPTPWNRWRARVWAADLRQRLLGRASAAREAIVHATGVYFPNRVHSVRIALKQLRYALEIADATGGLPMPTNAIRDIRKTQEILGDLHDRQVLLDRLASRLRNGSGTDVSLLRLVTETLEAEVKDLHARYLTRRQRLIDICDATRSTAMRRRAQVVSVAAAGALAAASTMYLLRRARPA